MTVALVILWFYVFGMMIRAVIMKQILWPQKQEDRDEGGWGKDEAIRTGELKSRMPSRQASDTALNSNGEKPPHLLAADPGEGQGQDSALDPEQVKRAADKGDPDCNSARSEISLAETEKAEVSPPRVNTEGLYMTASRATDNRSKGQNVELGGQEV